MRNRAGDTLFGIRPRPPSAQALAPAGVTEPDGAGTAGPCKDIRLDAGDLVLHLLAEAGQRVVAEDVEPRHHVDQAADVLDHRIAEYQRLCSRRPRADVRRRARPPRRDAGRGRPRRRAGVPRSGARCRV